MAVQGAGGVGVDPGELFTGMATDPESGPLLALLALAFWPAAPVRPAAQAGEA